MNLLFSCIGKRGYIADYFRPLLPAGSNIYGTSNTKWTAGFHSCDAGILMPDLAADNYHDAVLETCRSKSVKGIFSFFDPDVVRISEIKDQLLEQGTIAIVPDNEVAKICFDKFLTFQFLQSNGFGTPLSFVDIDKAKAAISSEALKYPLIVKPRCGFGSRATFVANNENELDIFFAYESGMMIQEKIAGEAFDFEVCCDLEGVPVSAVLWRKLRSTLGETEHVITCKDQKLLDVGIRLAQCLKSAGPMDVDLFVNETGVHILEINPRFGGGYPVSHLAGADFPGKLMMMLNGQTVTPDLGNYQGDVVMVKKLSIIGGPKDVFWRETLRIEGADGNEK